MKKTSQLLGILGSVVFVLGCNHPDPRLAHAPKADDPLLITSVDYTASAATHYRADILNQLRSELLDCGIGTKEGLFGRATSGQPRCIDSVFRWGTSYYLSQKALADGTILLFATFESKDNTSAFVLVTSHAKDLNTTFQSAELYFIDSMSSRRFGEIEDAYQKKTLDKIANLSSPENPEQYALDAIKQENSPRKVYHLATYLSDRIGRVEPQAILQALQDQTPIFLSSKDAFYQKAFLLFLRDKFPTKTDLLVSIARQFLAVTNSDVSQLAAIILAERQVVDANIRNLVMQALSNQDPEIRVLAIPAFATIRTGIGDELVIIGFLADSHYEVRRAAYETIEKFTLGEPHVAALKAHMALPESSIRQSVVNLLGKVVSRSSTSVLIHALEDSNYDVRRDANNVLERRALFNQDLPDLVKIYGNVNSYIRQSAVRQIGRISTPEAANILITAAEDSNYDVRRDALNFLEDWNLSDQHLSALTKLLSNPSSYIRQSGVRLLGKILSTDSSNLLIQALLDDNYDVRRDAYTILEGRALSDQNLADLQKVLNSSNSYIRQSAVRLIGNIFSIVATSLLIPSLEDSNYDVRRDANNALERRTFVDAHVTQLGSLLTSAMTSARQSAARLLGKSNSRRAYDLLVARLPAETDYDVKRAIQSSIDILKKNLGL